jgi:hypothetical protein
MHTNILLKKPCMLLILVAGCYEHGNEPSSTSAEVVD